MPDEREARPIVDRGCRGASDCLDGILVRPEHRLHMRLARGGGGYVSHFTALQARTECRGRPGRRRRPGIDVPGGRRAGPTVRDLYAADRA